MAVETISASRLAFGSSEHSSPPGAAVSNCWGLRKRVLMRRCVTVGNFRWFSQLFWEEERFLSMLKGVDVFFLFGRLLRWFLAVFFWALWIWLQIFENFVCFFCGIFCAFFWRIFLGNFYAIFCGIILCCNFYGISPEGIFAVLNLEFLRHFT